MIAIRRMQVAELGRIAEVDRSEHVKQIYVNRDGTLIRKEVDWHIHRWPVTPPKDTVAGQMKTWGPILEAGGTMFGAFDSTTLVGFSIYRPDLSPDTAQLVAIFVSRDYRGQKLGSLLVDKVVETARADGARKLYVSSTPTTSAVDFYMSKGFALTKEVNDRLFELEPGDIHMIMKL